MIKSDEALLEAARGGDEAAFAALVEVAKANLPAKESAAKESAAKESAA